jgi:hypothetical protein
MSKTSISSRPWLGQVVRGRGLFLPGPCRRSIRPSFSKRADEIGC